MSLMLNKFASWRSGALFSADEAAGAGADPAPAPAADASPETVLYPDDSAKPESEAKPAEAEAKPAAEWKEYEPDPAKSDEENAAAKAEHDKGKPAEADKADDADKVPEDGKYDLKMPEGIELDQAMVDAVAPVFKEIGLTASQAQKLTDAFIARQTEAAVAQQKEWGDTVAGWADTARKDAEIGGPKWDDSVSAAKKALDKFGTPELREYLNASGAGNHPEVIRAFARAGAAISDDNPASSGGQNKAVARDAAAILYPDDAPKGN